MASLGCTVKPHLPYKLGSPNLNWDSVLYLATKKSERFLSELLIRQVMMTIKQLKEVCGSRANRESAN